MNFSFIKKSQIVLIRSIIEDLVSREKLVLLLSRVSYLRVCFLSSRLKPLLPPKVPPGHHWVKYNPNSCARFISNFENKFSIQVIFCCIIFQGGLIGKIYFEN